MLTGAPHIRFAVGRATRVAEKDKPLPAEGPDFISDTGVAIGSRTGYTGRRARSAAQETPPAFGAVFYCGKRHSGAKTRRFGGHNTSAYGSYIGPFFRPKGARTN